MFSLGVLGFWLMRTGALPFKSISEYDQRKVGRLEVFGFGDFATENKLQMLLLSCISPEPSKRPTIATIVDQLTFLALAFSIDSSNVEDAIAQIGEISLDRASELLPAVCKQGLIKLLDILVSMGADCTVRD